MAKTTAIIELGYNTKIVCPIAKLSAIMAILENCSIVNEQSLKENFTGELDERGNAPCDYNRYHVETGDDITAKIVPVPNVLTRDEYRRRDNEATARENAIKEALPRSHPWQIKVGNSDYFTGERFRTMDEAIAFGQSHYTGKRKGFSLYEGDAYFDQYEATEAAD